MAAIPNAKKGLFRRYDPNVYLYYDRVFNKGGTLNLLLHLILPHYKGSDNPPLLFTAGDGLFDLPLLFMPLQSQAYLRPSEQSEEKLYEDLASLNLTADDIKKVTDLWQGGINALPRSRDLYIALERSNLLFHESLFDAATKNLRQSLIIWVYLHRQHSRTPKCVLRHSCVGIRVEL